jgi:hypothetical protein
MAEPTCSCGSSAFAVSERQVAGTTLTYAIVHCDSCGAPIGVLEQGNVNSALEQQEAAIDELATQVAGADVKIDDVLRQLQALAKRLKSG